MSHESMSCCVVGLARSILLGNFCLVRGCLVAGISTDSVMSLQRLYLNFASSNVVPTLVAY